MLQLQVYLNISGREAIGSILERDTTDTIPSLLFCTNHSYPNGMYAIIIYGKIFPLAHTVTNNATRDRSSNEPSLTKEVACGGWVNYLQRRSVDNFFVNGAVADTNRSLFSVCNNVCCALCFRLYAVPGDQGHIFRGNPSQTEHRGASNFDSNSAFCFALL